MFFAKILALIGTAALVAHALPQSEHIHDGPTKRAFSAFSPAARALHSSRTLSASMTSVLEARDAVAARCTTRTCPCEARRLVDRFFDIAQGAIAARQVSGDIRCVGTEEEFVERAYEEAKRDVALLPRQNLNCPGGA
ncbi:hypothetical protein B0H17DRAFT_1298766 [Mycena rosella]|uniref:Uncharacterized protein n=1 Tax=Mycena rosella TaxID=1033263 RepID=A0AAD7GUG0_MYCRO|nr:hypothetical protein B0H17DRAFT_1298766 [Mycena rosella]